MRSLRDEASDVGFALVPSHIVWDIESTSGDLLDAFEGHDDVVIALDALRSLLPVPVDLRPREFGRFYRLENHHRSFCYGATVASAERLFDSPAIVLKGLEPLSRDFPDYVAWMKVAPFRSASRLMADHFALAEGKVPGALTLREGLSEARIALAVQTKHLQHYGALARMPLPLLVHEFDAESTRHCLNALRARLNSRAFERTAPTMSGGLAAYVYVYPNAPVRANVWSGGGSALLRSYVKRTFKLDTAVRRWVELLCRLLLLGYLPYSAWNEGLGACFEAGNATLDGGVCDVDSIVGFDEAPDERFVIDSVGRSFRVLEQTVSTFMRSADAGAAFQLLRFLLTLLDQYLFVERPSGLVLDSRVLAALQPPSMNTIEAGESDRAKRPRTFSAFLAQSRPPTTF